jgi:hypothetical protein
MSSGAIFTLLRDRFPRQHEGIVSGLGFSSFCGHVPQNISQGGGVNIDMGKQIGKFATQWRVDEILKPPPGLKRVFYGHNRLGDEFHKNIRNEKNDTQYHRIQIKAGNFSLCFIFRVIKNFFAAFRAPV